MEDEDIEKLQIEKRDGDEAKKALENGIIKRALQGIRGDLYLRFEQTKATDSAERDEIWRELMLLSELENKLRYVVQTGELAKETLLSKVKRSIGL